jgi:ABC-type antimicrobial peptide transport system permease subunit
VVFGLIGLAAGTAVLLVLGATGLAAPNLFFQVLFGGPVLHPVVSPAAALTAVLAVVVIGLLASLYPVRLALRVRPVQAMQSE